MIKIKELQKVINDTACPDGFLYHIEQQISEYNDENIEEFRKHILLIVKILLEKNVIVVVEPFTEKPWTLSPKDIVNKINSKWKSGIEHEEYYNIVWLKMSNEFKKKLINDGYIIGSNWNNYINKTEWLQELLYVNENNFMNRLKEI